MEDLKQLEPTLPHYRENPKPPIPEKKPIEAATVSPYLDDMKPTHRSPLKSHRSANTEPTSPSLSLGPDTMGSSKTELPAPEYVSRSKGPRSTSSQTSQSRAHSNESNGGSSQETRLYREIDGLRQKLKSSTARAEIAEEKTARIEKRIQELKTTKASGLSETEREIESLACTLSELKVENSALKEQLRDAQSHIFSLQPYRKEFTPEEIGSQYDDLIEGISDWVAKFMAPLLDNHTKAVEETIAVARKKPTDANKLKHMIHTFPDLVHGTMYPETDEDIIISIIMRFLYDNIFQKTLYGSIAHYVEVLSFVETSLQNHVDPKRDLFAIRTWTAEAYNAIISSREFKGVREQKLRELTMELAGIFKIFCKKDRIDDFRKSFEQHCIKPAMQLYEKIQVSTHHFYFDINPYMVWGPNGDFQPSRDFFDDLHNLDCKNILHNRKAFNLSKMDPPPSEKELFHRLLNVCTLTPALYMRQIGRKDVIKEPQLVRRQEMLVAWGPQEKREAFMENGDQTLLSHLYAAKYERERAEAGGWATFRWGG
nr:uncharacterized protein CTRU02_10008 [Colletotrichum truncatum]KAF6787713.1 hypothetical protein CTRU02_10008 [Colletotrichum truncatum]